jgi:hypothetical protein
LDNHDFMFSNQSKITIVEANQPKVKAKPENKFRVKTGDSNVMFRAQNLFISLLSDHTMKIKVLV